VAEEAEIAAAREYLEQVRRAEPVAWQADAADVRAAAEAEADAATAPASPAAVAGEPAPGGADDRTTYSAFAPLDAPAGPLFLVLTDAGAELRDEDGALLYGRLVDLPDTSAGPVVGAEMADCVCRIGAERDRRGRLVAARLEDGSVVAACHLAWRAGGHIWLATEDWYRLRSKPLASGPAWTLMAGDGELAEIRPLPNHGLEIDLLATPADVVLLLLLVVMVIHAETAPLAEPAIAGTG
jgi:hypothetical protein